jgi:menaquinone-dependent protoporphyrinogen oxidase
MIEKILVTYATRNGSTKEVAEAIGEVLRARGSEADVVPISRVENIILYDAMVIGSAIHSGCWLPEAVEFVAKHHLVLCQTQVAYFATCATLAENTPERRTTVLGYLAPVLEAVPDVQPCDVGLFAGAYDVKKLSFPLRLMMMTKRLPQGDFRDWQAVQHWAQEIHPALTTY